MSLSPALPALCNVAVEEGERQIPSLSVCKECENEEGDSRAFF